MDDATQPGRVPSPQTEPRQTPDPAPAAQPHRPGYRRALIKVKDPRNGISREEYEALCAQLGVAPVYETKADAEE